MNSLEALDIIVKKEVDTQDLLFDAKSLKQLLTPHYFLGILTSHTFQNSIGLYYKERNYTLSELTFNEYEFLISYFMKEYC